MKKSFCLVLVLALLVALTACTQTPTSSGTASTTTQATTQGSGSTTATTTQAASQYPDYLNLDGYHPIVKEGQEAGFSITIFVDSGYSNDPYSRYYWKAMEEIYNIKCDVTQVLNTGADEYIALAFASDNLTDVTLGKSLTPTQMVLYGSTEGQLLDLSQYMDETLTPAIWKLLEDHPDMRTGITLPDGAIYAYPYITDPANPSAYSKRNIRESWLTELGLEMPKTLDEFVDVMYKFKEKGEDVIPFGGAYASSNPSAIIFQALGVITQDATGTAPGVRNKKIIIPGGDKEVFGEYLKLMNKFYQDKIIDPDFFTLDTVGVSAKATEGKLGVIATDPFAVCPDYDMFSQYTALGAMTSALNDTAFAVKKPTWTCGGCFVSVNAENKELIARWADWMCTNEGTHAAWVGACRNEEHLMLEGYGGWYCDEKWSRVDYDRVDVEGGTTKWENAVVYLKSLVAGFNMGSIGTTIGENRYRHSLSNLPVLEYYDWYKASPENGDYYWRISAMEAFDNIQVSSLTTLVYYDEDTSDRITELASVINAHIEAESAKFITGARSLNELDNYFTELDNLGFQEYLGYYAQAYAAALGNY